MFNTFIYLMILTSTLSCRIYADHYIGDRIVRVDINQEYVDITTREYVYTNYFYSSWPVSGDSRNGLYKDLVWTKDVDFVNFYSDFTFRVKDKNALEEVAHWKLGQKVSFFINGDGGTDRLLFGNTIYNEERAVSFSAVLLGGKVNLEQPYPDPQFDPIYNPKYPKGIWKLSGSSVQSAL